MNVSLIIVWGEPLFRDTVGVRHPFVVMSMLKQKNAEAELCVVDQRLIIRVN